MRRPLFAWEAMGRSRRAVMLLMVGGGVMMIGRATTGLAEGGQSSAGTGAAIIQGNVWDPQAASVRRGRGGRQAEGQEGDAGQSH